ncbi:MAG: hypothetical protein PVG79_17400, partial [Gemmatimonadales bacterium]
MNRSRVPAGSSAGALMIALVLFALAGARFAASGPRTIDPHYETAASDSLTQVFEVDGIRAILRKVLTNDVVAVNLYLLGGAR